MVLEQGFQIGAIRVEPRNGRLLRAGDSLEIEPKVMALLCLLAETPGEAVSKAVIFQRLWPDVTVNDDALSRTVWKLRQALGDDARNPVYIATVPKRGYRLLVMPSLVAASPGAAGAMPGPASASGAAAPRPAIMIAAAVAIAALVLAVMVWGVMGARQATGHAETASLVARADEFYYQFTEADNAAAMRLYQQALEQDPVSAPALAGLANTQTQSVVRWSPGDWPETGLRSRVRTALANGRTQTPAAIEQLGRARAHAEAAVAADPDYALAYRALGLVQSAQGEVDAAMETYSRAATLDPDAWEIFINLSDMHAHRGEADLALAYMEQGFEAMSRVYESQTVQVRPWYSTTGLSVARGYRNRGDAATAERWYRRVLQWDPLNDEALSGLAAILVARGDLAGAREVCAPLAEAEARATCLAGP